MEGVHFSRQLLLLKCLLSSVILSGCQKPILVVKGGQIKLNKADSLIIVKHPNQLFTSKNKHVLTMCTIYIPSQHHQFITSNKYNE